MFPAMLASIGKVNPAQLNGKGFTMAGTITGLHSVVGKDAGIVIFIRDGKGDNHIVTFAQTGPDTIGIAFEHDRAVDELLKL